MRKRTLKRCFSCIISICLVLCVCFGFSGCINVDHPYIQKVNQAIIDEDMDALKELLSQKKNINNREYAIAVEAVDGQIIRNHSPLVVAILYDNFEAVKLLVEHGANVNYPSVIHGFYETPLHIAAARCDLEIVEYLVEQGADANVSNNYGKPIIYCIYLPHYYTLCKGGKNEEITEEEWRIRKFETFCCLLENGTKLDDDFRYGHLIFETIYSRWIDEGKYLLDNYQIDCNISRKTKKDIFGQTINNEDTILMAAAKSGNFEFCQMLLDYGADKTLKNIYNDTAYDIAVEKGYEAIADLLR